MNPEAFVARRAAFRKLHESGFFVIPNPWNIGTARYLRSLGFKALATTSSGFAFANGLPDAEWAITREMALQHIRTIVESVGSGPEALPINADFESGYAHAPDQLAENVRLCVATGVAGLSIEDATGDPSRPLYDLALGIERIRAARAAIDQTGTGVLLTARAESFLVNVPDPLTDALRRLTAYADAGADVLYAPGLRTRAEIEAVVSAVSPKPVNVIITSSHGVSLPELAAIGVRRVSVGSALARAAWTGFLQAAHLIARENSMAGLDNAIPFADLNTFFRKDQAQRAIDDADKPQN
jgi:2-methylisocitrate lyase-like PEP mutase family enzyme